MSIFTKTRCLGSTYSFIWLIRLLTIPKFGGEDFCADTSITRSSDATELLYARSKIVTYAKCFNMQAIDFVCIDFKNLDQLRNECLQGHSLGFDGKQAIHPSQGMR